MKLLPVILFGFMITACQQTNSVDDFGIEPSKLKSGFEFLTPDNQNLQRDNFSNPGYLWVQKGRDFFEKNGCEACHTETDVAGSFAGSPKIHKASGQLMNLQGQINYCRTARLSDAPLAYESEDMLGLVSYVKNLSLGQPLKYEITDSLRPHFQAGKSYYFTRRGQFNLSCAQCHDNHWGAKMRGDIVSQGHINGFPAFRNDWQTLGSSHRRFQACNAGIGAETSPLGSETYLELEIYLMARGSQLKNETPAIRR